MKFINKILALICITCVNSDEYLRKKNSLDYNKLTGNWIQISNNHYIQETSEIDWSCIKVSINKTDTNTIKISKSPYIHNIYYAPNKLTTNYYIKDRLLDAGNYSLIIKKVGPIVENKYDYTILAGTNNISLFILARDYNRYDNYRGEVDKLLDLWNYTTYIKKPLPTYEVACIVPSSR